VRTTYRGLAEADPGRFRVIDGSGTVEESDAAIRAIVKPLVG
jgi:thymidylate kinase